MLAPLVLQIISTKPIRVSQEVYSCTFIDVNYLQRIVNGVKKALRVVITAAATARDVTKSEDVVEVQ